MLPERLMDRPSLVPELYVSRLSRSLHFYVDLLGFAVEYARPEERFASLALGGARLMLEETRSLDVATVDELSRGEFRIAELRAPFGRGINLELRVPDVDAIARRLSAASYPMLLEPYEKSYRVAAHSIRVRQLLVADPDGYLIRPSQVLETHA
jgi:catechol 2,3-dioxygenase-like lactoylglutathione lyase family enzyme